MLRTLTIACARLAIQKILTFVQRKEMTSAWRDDVQCDTYLAERVGDEDKGLLHDARLLTRRSAPPLPNNAPSSALPNCAQHLRMAVRARERNDEEAYESAIDRLLDFFLASGAPPTPAQVRNAFHLGKASASDERNEEEVLHQLPFMDRDAVQRIVGEPIDVDALDALREAEHARDLALHN